MEREGVQCRFLNHTNVTIKFPVKLAVVEKTYFCEKYKKMAFNSRMRAVLENTFKIALLWPRSLANACCASVPSSLLGPKFKTCLDQLSGTWWGCPGQEELTLWAPSNSGHTMILEKLGSLLGHFWGKMLAALQLFTCASLGHKNGSARPRSPLL